MRAIKSAEQMYQVVRAAISSGINHIETAPSYGPAEAFLGKALKKLNQERITLEEDVIITSKILPGVDFETGKFQIIEQLKRLNIPKINNLAIHGLNLNEHLDWAQKGEGKKILEWAQFEGLVEQVGFSSHGSKCLIEDAISDPMFTFCSLHLHLFDQYRLPLARMALSKGMGVMAISPADKGGHLHTPSKILIEDCKPIHPLILAYRFLLAQGISTLTLGASKPEDLTFAKQLRSSDYALTKKEVNVIDKLKRSAEYRLKETKCGQCRKCLPCPQQIPIPEILRLRNLALGNDLTKFAKERYNLIGRASHWWEQVNASSCKKCEACLPRCPHELPIPELLNETHKLLTDSPKRRLWD